MKKLENDTLLSVVKSVWSILPSRRPVQSQSSAELDSCLGRTLGSPSSISAPLNGENIDKVNALDGDLSSSSKVDFLIQHLEFQISSVALTEK